MIFGIQNLRGYNDDDGDIDDKLPMVPDDDTQRIA